MSIHTHEEALRAKHQELETKISDESNRPFPDFSTITSLKKHKLSIKEELFSLGTSAAYQTAS